MRELLYSGTLARELSGDNQIPGAILTGESNLFILEHNSGIPEPFQADFSDMLFSREYVFKLRTSLFVIVGVITTVQLITQA